MYAGSLPLLTRGPFALLFGGAPILPQLSCQPPGRGVLVLITVSQVFQGLIFLVKKCRRENRNYLKDLRQNLVDNVVNVYSIVIGTITTLASLTFITVHNLRVEQNLEKENDQLDTVFPAPIIVIMTCQVFVASLPFLTRPALR